jgi:hypothetical protein
MWWIFFPALVVTAVSSFGKPHEQLRTACNTFQGTIQAPCQSGELALEDIRRLSQKQLERQLNGAAIERLHWTSSTGGERARHDFTIGIAEFDDQGNAWDRDQIEAVKTSLTTVLQRSTTALVVVFIHGWKNNCEACNGDLKCIREALALLAASEKQVAAHFKIQPREVFGLYVGWRGASSTVEPAKEMSFFGRKAVADRIGGSRGGDMTNLLSWVDTVTAPNGRARVAPFEPLRLRSMVAYVGHSFGADVLFGTVANPLDAAIAAAPPKTPVQAFGDVLVLVNPAFEASAYRRFGEYARQSWPPDQRPLMLTVQARNDWATHYTFPAGRTIATVGQASSGGSGYREMLDALGHHAPYYTHHLDRPPANAETVGMLRTLVSTEMKTRPDDDFGALIESMGSKRSGEKCACDKIRAWDATLAALVQSVIAAAANPVPGEIGAPIVGFASRMVPCKPAGRDPNLGSPFLTIRTTADIVDGHSGIMRLEFFDFLANFLVRVDQIRQPEMFSALAAGATARPSSDGPGIDACR